MKLLRVIESRKNISYMKYLNKVRRMEIYSQWPFAKCRECVEFNEEEKFIEFQFKKTTKCNEIFTNIQ